MSRGFTIRVLAPGRHRDESGLAMITVIGITTVLAGLIVVLLTMTQRALLISTDHVSFEQSLAAAEAGIDKSLSQVAAAQNGSPPAEWLPSAECMMPTPTGAQTANDESERAYARDALLALPDSCTESTPQGDFVVSRAVGRQVLYALGWSPNRDADNAKIRLIKAEYLFAPYRPGSAVLTQADVDLSGSVTVNAVDASTPANVHTNGSVTAWNQSLAVTGSISASATTPGVGCPSGVTGGCVAAAPVESIPSISPRQVYHQALVEGAVVVDLCPDGQAHVPTTTTPQTAVPCSGPVDAAGARGWTYSNGTWTLPRRAANVSALFYVYHGNASVGDSGNDNTVRSITVVTESAQQSCPKSNGDIDWKLFNIHPYFGSLVFLADRDLSGSANAEAGPGLFMARGSVNLNTSSATITGAVIAANECGGVNTVQGVTIRYDDTVETPVNDVIRTSLWLEYPFGG